MAHPPYFLASFDHYGLVAGFYALGFLAVLAAGALGLARRRAFSTTRLAA